MAKVARSGQDRRDHPRPQLPDGNGLDLLRYWRARRVDCPVLILTARGSWQDKVEGLNAGAMISW
jgi:DNA-binding response OmpR family regulator